MDFLRNLIQFLAIVFLLSPSLSEAREILVGGKENSWNIPSNFSQTLNEWAQKTRFKVGDVLIWKYRAGEDSVLEVTEESYRSCNMSKPITKHDEGHTEIKLNHSGAFYFISGTKEHCEKGQNLAMVVMSRHHHHHHEPNNILAPAPTPAPADQPRPLAGTACGLSKNKLGMFAVGIGSLVTNYMLMF